nr:unnamed protein product [Spirometra erinaceieuropaei]
MRMPEKILQRLTDNGLKFDVWTGDSSIPPEIFRERVRGVKGIICRLSDRVDSTLLKAAGDQLKVVSTMSVGYDHLDLKALKARGQSSHGVVLDVKGDTRIWSLCLWGSAPEEGVASVHLLQLALFGEASIAECSNVHRETSVVTCSGRLLLELSKRERTFQSARMSGSPSRPVREMAERTVDNLLAGLADPPTPLPSELHF